MARLWRARARRSYLKPREWSELVGEANELIDQRVQTCSLMDLNASRRGQEVAMGIPQLGQSRDHQDGGHLAGSRCWPLLALLIVLQLVRAMPATCQEPPERAH